MNNKYTKKFEKWFREYGLMSDLYKIDDTYLLHAVKRIAYRAYKRGRYDQQKKKEKAYE